MKKKILLILFVIIFIFLLIFGIYKLIEIVDFKNSISHLENHTFISNEKIVKEFEYNHNHYAISRYFDDSSSWSHLNLFLKYNGNYYILKTIKKCDTTEDGSNIFVLNNEIYVHCIGTLGDINKYSINDFNIDAEILKFNYDNTPNISQLHMNIDGVDNEYIYLSSPFKVDNTSEENSKVKCSFKDRKCIYY